MEEIVYATLSCFWNELGKNWINKNPLACWGWYEWALNLKVNVSDYFLHNYIIQILTACSGPSKDTFLVSSDWVIPKPIKPKVAHTFVQEPSETQAVMSFTDARLVIFLSLTLVFWAWVNTRKGKQDKLLELVESSENQYFGVCNSKPKGFFVLGYSQRCLLIQFCLLFLKIDVFSI